MKRRFNGAGSTSFFAFQDIITAVMGIMVLIALLMALQLTSGPPPKPRVDPALVRLHADLSDERDHLHAQVAGIVATAKAGASTDNTAADITNTQDMIRALNAESARLVQDAQLVALSSPSDIDVSKVLQANDEAKQALAKREEENRQRAKEIGDVEGQVEKAQSSALRVAGNTTDIWLTPERSDSSKEPVIVSVLRDFFVAQPLDAGREKRVNRTSDTKANLATALEGNAPTGQFVVLYFKPSTLPSFDDVVQAAKSLGYEVGYDIVEEEGTVRFTTAPVEEESAPEPVSTSTPDDAGVGEFVGEVDIQAEVEKRGDPIANGSGFFVSTAGHFVTNEHVASAGRIYFIGSKTAGWRRAKLLGVDEQNDLALLKIEEGTIPFFVKDSDAVRLGQTVATIGFPNVELQGLSPKFTKGEISSLAGIQDDPSTFQISVPVQPGNSGGALFDEGGHVVGVISARLDQDAAVALTGTHTQNVNYAVKSKILLRWLKKMSFTGLDLPADESTSGSFQDAIQKAEQSTAMILIYP